jgi:hypothetical protein
LLDKFRLNATDDLSFKVMIPVKNVGGAIGHDFQDEEDVNIILEHPKFTRFDHK